MNSDLVYANIGNILFVFYIGVYFINLQVDR